MENWGSFFDQAPTSEAAMPVAAMRAAVRGGPKVFPTANPIGPSTMLQSPPTPRMDMVGVPEMSREKPTNEWADMAQNAADMIDPEGAAARKAAKEGGGKPDAYGQTMSSIDQQLQAMKAEREKLVASLGKDGATSTGVAGAAGPLPPGSVEGVFGNMIQQESGGQHFTKDGKLIMSSAGARGIAQIMPGTAPIAAKLAGLPWDPELFNRGPTGDPAKDAEARDYNLKLGRAYYDEQLRVFGDPLLAAAAYNAGPGAVSAALAKAKASGRSYLEFLPAETQNYVQIVGRTKVAEKAEGGRVRWLRSLVGA